jgi:hypothetical protein
MRGPGGVKSEWLWERELVGVGKRDLIHMEIPPLKSRK